MFFILEFKERTPTAGANLLNMGKLNSRPLKDTGKIENQSFALDSCFVWLLVDEMSSPHFSLIFTCDSRNVRECKN